MTGLVPLGPPALPVIIAAAGECASVRFLEFFASTIRNPHSPGLCPGRIGLLTWCADHGVASIAAVQPLHVATWVELQIRERAAPTVKLRLAAIRHLFDWLVMGKVVPLNPASSVRGRSHSVRKGKTPVLDPIEAWGPDVGGQEVDALNPSEPDDMRGLRSDDRRPGQAREGLCCRE